MADKAKIYNVQFLDRYTSLNTAQGRELYGGSRQAYFAKLSEFEEKAPALLINLPDIRPKKEALADLNALQKLLHGLCETQIVEQIDDMMIIVNLDKDRKAIGNGLHTIWTNLTRLVQRIKESVITMDDDAPDAAPAPAGDAASPLDTSHGKRMKIPVSSTLFSRLASLLEEFDFEEAAKEANSLMDFSFDEEIDRIIISISDSLSESDFKGANAKVKHLLKRASEKENEKTAPPPPPVQTKKTILAIDDMPDILTLIKNMLKNQFNVYCVPNHLAALKFVASNTPDLILLDIEMPDMDGFSLLKILRQTDECKNVPVIFLTSNVTAENVRTSVLSGGNDFVKKPVDYDLLISKINRQLEMVKK